jgi:hypothetical protein
MKKVIYPFFVIVVFTLSSCAIHNGYMNNSASLSQANFSYVGNEISGTASTMRVFGIGGLNKQAIVAEAKRNMLKNHPLKENQALANITVNWKLGFYLIVVNDKCTVTADIVEFKSGLSTKKEDLTTTSNDLTEENNNEIVKDSIINEIAKDPKYIILETSNFKVGDSVEIDQYYAPPILGVIVKIENNRYYYVSYKSKYGGKRTIKVKAKQLKKIKMVE